MIKDGYCINIDSWVLYVGDILDLELESERRSGNLGVTVLDEDEALDTVLQIIEIRFARSAFPL